VKVGGGVTIEKEFNLMEGRRGDASLLKGGLPVSRKQGMGKGQKASLAEL